MLSKSLYAIPIFSFALFTDLALAVDTAIEEQPEELDEVVVYGEGYRTTGTKSALPPMEAPISYETYNADLLQQRQANSVNEALRYAPGITPENRGTVTIFDQYTIRGFQNDSNYYDGLALQFNGLWNLSPQVDIFATESVEVLKGPTSVLYGSAPPGGLVNQVAKQPLPYEKTQFRLRFGTNKLVELGVDHNGVASDAVNYRVIAMGRQKDGQMTTTEEERTLFAPSASWQVNEKTNINFNLYHQEDPKSLASTPLPGVGTVIPASWGKLDNDAYAGDKNWNNVDKTVTMLGYKINHQFNDRLTFLQNLRYTDGELLQRNTYHFSPAGQILTRSAYLTDEAIEGVAVDNQLALETSLGETNHKFLLGIDYRQLDSYAKYRDTFGTATPTIDMANPNHDQFDVNTIEANFIYTDIHDIEQEQVGFYLQDEIKWHDLTLLANLRRDIYESSDESAVNGAPSTKTKIDQKETSGRLAAMYKLKNGLAPYVSYATSYEPTSGVDSFSGKAFKPTTAEQYEVGIKFSSEKTGLTIAAFDITQKNKVVNTPDFAQKTQRGAVTSEGFELALRTQLSEQIDLQASYNQQEVKVSKNPLNTTLIGKTPVWVADKQASLWTTYYVSDDLDLSLGLRHIGKSQIDAENTGTVPNYTLGDMAVSYSVSDKTRLGLTVSNLADKRYVSACFNRDNCWMGSERSVELNLQIDL